MVQQSIEHKLRVAVIVSPDPSDIYFANCLALTLDVVGIVVENQQLPKDTTPIYLKALRSLSQPQEVPTKICSFIAEQYRKQVHSCSSSKYSADFGELGSDLRSDLKCPAIYTEGVSRVSDERYVSWLRSVTPDVLAVCGASILKESILSVPAKASLNLHGGLSQRYRGLFTSDWALYNEEPEYVGATVHYISPGIDDGEIVFQGRPELSIDDHPNSVYEKVVKLGVRMMISAIEQLEVGCLKSSPLPHRGKLYIARDYTPAAKRRVWQSVKNGSIRTYLADQADRDRNVLPYLINRFDADVTLSGTGT